MAQQGVGSYQPFLNAALTAQQQAAGTIGGLSSLTGPQAYQPFMSPYQTQVIDDTLQTVRSIKSRGPKIYSRRSSMHLVTLVVVEKVRC